MKRVFVLLLFVFVFSINFAFSSSSAPMNVTAQISPTEIGISVPDNLVFNNITCGYWQKEQIKINNTGNVDISVTPSLDLNYSGEILQNLGFSTSSPGTGSSPSILPNIGNYSFRVNKPDNIGKVNEDNIYFFLDLTNYTNCTNVQIIDSANVIFTAVQA